jgi:hypothetical protein
VQDKNVQAGINVGGDLINFLSDEIIGKLKERETALQNYHDLLAQKENELANLKNKQLERESQLNSELKNRESLFLAREKELFERQKEVEDQLRKRKDDVDRLQSKLAQREAYLAQALQVLEHEKARYNEESRKQIEGKSRDYVSDALNSLDKKAKDFHLLSIIWSSIGALSLLVGLVFFGYVTIKSLFSFPTVVTWEFITFSVVKGLIAVALFIALAKYAFLFSNSYMQEALKNGDRRHAINFGKFYLELYGAAAEWSQIKEAFEHWNIVGSNAFSKREEKSLDVTSLEKVASIIEKISKSLPLQDKGKDSE